MEIGDWRFDFIAYMYFKDRADAGKKLSKSLEKYRNKDAVVYALPRGGVILGEIIARELNLPLSLVITRKIGHPMQREYAVCVVAEDGHMICNEDEKPSLTDEWLRKQIEIEKLEAKRRREVYLPNHETLSAKDKISIIVDDGIATGLTMELAIRELRHDNPKKIIVAVPVITKDTADKFNKEEVELVALEFSEFHLGSVGAYYENFPQVEDEEVIKILKDVATKH